MLLKEKLTVNRSAGLVRHEVGETLVLEVRFEPHDVRITTEAVQVFGAAGLSCAGPVERLMRDAKAFQIYDGTSQIQKSVIGRQLQKSGLPFDYLDSGGYDLSQ